jgi:hypothetical protein
MPADANKRTFLIFRFWLCSHESSLPRKERIISRALAHPVGLLRRYTLLAHNLELLTYLFPLAADEQRRLQVNVKPAGDIRLEKYLLLGGRFERNGLGWCNQHRVLSRLRSCWSPSANGGPSPVLDE